MTFIPLPNGIQLCFDFLTGGQNWQFCLSLRKSAGTPTPTDLATITNAAKTWWNASLQDNMSHAATLRQIRATDMTVQGGPQDILTVGEVGDNTAEAAPNNAAVVISGRTQLRGRSYRGRSYLSGIYLTDVVSPVDISSGLATTYASAWTGLQTALDALGFDVVVASKQHNGAVINPANLNEVIEFVCDTHLDSQRRRLAGRGT